MIFLKEHFIYYLHSIGPLGVCALITVQRSGTPSDGEIT